MNAAIVLSLCVVGATAASSSSSSAGSLNARKCEFVASDGSHYDISPLFIAARKSSIGDESSNGISSHGSAPVSGVDASIVALPYWSAYFGNAGTLALNPCGGIQNLHNDCPVDARGEPTNSFVQLRSSSSSAQLGTAEHRAAHCVGWGTAASMQFQSADDPHAGFKILIASGTDGRSATLNFVCGRSTGEITAFAPSGDGTGATASLTFLTKYACPKSADADAELDRQRQKEADRKARQKLQQNYATLKQARLSPDDDIAKRSAAAAAAASGSGAVGADGKQRKGFAKMRELGLHSAAVSRSIDDMMEAERRKREQRQFVGDESSASSEDSDLDVQSQFSSPQQQVAPPPPPPPQQQQQQQQQQQPAQSRTVPQAKAFPGGVRRDGRSDAKKDPVSLDVYQQLLAKMREKAAKQGVTAEQAAHRSAQAQARVESDPIQLQLRRRDEAAVNDAVEDDQLPTQPKLDDDDASDGDQDRLAARHAAMRQAAQRYDSNEKNVADNAAAVNANDLRRSLGELDSNAPRKRDAGSGGGLVSSLLASPTFGNQLLLVLLLLVASALGVAWYRVKAQENAAAAAAQRAEVFGGNNSAPSSPVAASSAASGGRVYEYDAVADFEARSTKYTYERFVAELASKSNAPVTDADESEQDDLLSNLLPPAPSSSVAAASSSAASTDAYSNGLSRRARSPDSGTDHGTNKND